MVTGPLVALSRATGQLVSGFPRVSTQAGSSDSELSGVLAIVGDGSGGWYVGGNFRSAGDVACANLVHIRGDRTVDRGWCPRPDGGIHALLRLGTTLYVGGHFMSRIASTTRYGLAAFDTKTGHLVGWNPNVTSGDPHPHNYSGVDGLAADPTGRHIYFLGNFSTVGGLARSDLAAVDARSGRPTPFAPNPDRDRHGDGITTIAVTATRVYAWGFYNHIAGKPSRGITAALDPRTGKVLAWEPTMTGYYTPEFTTTVVGDRVFIGGLFDSLGGQRRSNLAAFSGSTAAVDGWAAGTGGEFIVPYAIAVAGPLLFADLGKWMSGGPHEVAAYDTTSGRRAWQTRPSNDPNYHDLRAIAASESLVLVGGAG